MNTVNCFKLVVILLWLPVGLFSQTFFDIARLDFIQIPTSYQNESNSFKVREYNAALNLGFKTAGEDRLLIGWNGEKRTINIAEESPYNKPLFLNVASVGYIRDWQDSPWRLLLMSRIKLGSDYDVWAADDLSWGVLAAATFTNKNKVSFTLGGHYGEELFGPLIFPIFGIDMKLSERTYLYAFFPAEVRIEQALSPSKLYTSVVLNWITNSYGLHQVPQNSFIRTEELMLRAFLDFHITKEWVLFGALGHTLINKYDLKSDGQELLLESPFDKDFKNGLILDFGLAFRIRFKN